MEPQSNPNQTIVVTGLSGAGRQTALNALEDCGYHAIDNLPAELIPHVIENNSTGRPLALGLGSRRTDREYLMLNDIIAELGGELNIALLFLEADDEVIMRRYNETRRVHPGAQGRSVLSGIAHERTLLLGLRNRAHVIIDTTRLSPHDLRAEIKKQFDLEKAQTLLVTVESFSYKFGTPPNADMILDCRFLKNPHWEPDLRAKTGQFDEVQAYVQSDENFSKFFKDTKSILGYVLPAMEKDGRSYFTIAFGCTGGKHRSVTLAEQMGSALKAEGYEVLLEHRELKKTGLL